MSDIKHEIADIIAQSNSLFEYLSDANVTKSIDRQNKTNDDYHQYTKQWCNLIAQEDWEKFQTRLEWDDLQIEQVNSLIELFPVQENETIPQWSETLTQIIKTAFNWNLQQELDPLFLVDLAQKIDVSGYDTNINPIDANEPLPFEHILLPIVLVARKQLLSEYESKSLQLILDNLLSEQAYINLERSLLQKLVKICEKTLITEFSSFRPLGMNLINCVIEKKDEAKNNDRYKKFVRDLLQDGLW